jgi:uncharacterized protein
MNPKIFINLPVANLPAAMDFYTRIGFVNEPMFTDETAAAMKFSEEIYVMLLTHNKYKQFTQKPIADAKATSPALYALQMESTSQMNRLADAAEAAGGKQASEPKDYGFMQQRSFEDLDGHTWEVFCMDISKFPQPQTAEHA